MSAHPQPHPQPPTPVDAPRERSNLALRLVTAALLIPPVTYGIFADPLWVLGIVVIFILIGVTEFYQLIEAKGVEPLRSFGTAAAVTIPFVVFGVFRYLFLVHQRGEGADPARLLFRDVSLVSSGLLWGLAVAAAILTRGAPT